MSATDHPDGEESSAAAALEEEEEEGRAASCRLLRRTTTSGGGITAHHNIVDLDDSVSSGGGDSSDDDVSLSGIQQQQDGTSSATSPMPRQNYHHQNRHVLLTPTQPRKSHWTPVPGNDKSLNSLGSCSSSSPRQRDFNDVMALKGGRSEPAAARTSSDGRPGATWQPSGLHVVASNRGISSPTITTTTRQQRETSQQLRFGGRQGFCDVMALKGGGSGSGGTSSSRSTKGGGHETMILSSGAASIRRLDCDNNNNNGGDEHLSKNGKSEAMNAPTKNYSDKNKAPPPEAGNSDSYTFCGMTETEEPDDHPGNSGRAGCYTYAGTIRGYGKGTHQPVAIAVHGRTTQQHRENSLPKETLSQLAVNADDDAMNAGDSAQEDNDNDNNGNSNNNNKRDGLAVASLVPTDEELQRATEYEPKMTASAKRLRRLCLACTLFGLLVLSTIVIIVTLSTVVAVQRKQQRDNLRASTPAPTPSPRERLGIRNHVYKMMMGNSDNSAAAASSSPFADPSSPHSKALDWIIHGDPTEPVPDDDDSFGQRYVLAYVYFATTIPGSWTSCNPPPPPPGGGAAKNESSSSSSGTTATMCYYWHDEYTPRQGNKWLSNTTECSWAGIQCDAAGNVEKIRQYDLGMSGEFPADICNLPFLMELELVRGSLRGPLPENLLSRCKHLVHLDLSYNLLTGTIPERWCESRNLQHLDLRNNKLAGTLSEKMGNWVDMKDLHLDENSFSGTLPTLAMGKLRSVKSFTVSKNSFTGTLPTTLGYLKYTSEFYFDHNSFRGTIPTEIGNMINLWAFQGSDNELSGTIPDALWHSNRVFVHLSDNNLNGTLGSQVGRAPNLESLLLDNNNLEGQFPTELGLMPRLEVVTLFGNDFRGAIPDELCRLRTNRHANVGNFHVLEADCAPSLETGSPASVACPEGCCTKCCESHHGYCYDP